jgi:glyoxylase-like metal-dependent hydrolase (beta-lactamase superfamily II)
MTAWTLDIVEVCLIPQLPLSIYLPDADPETTFDVPCYCYLLTRPGETVVVDSGADRSVSAAAGFTIGGDARAALTDALRRRGLSPEDVDTVIHTHLHYDHMQNDALFPRARVVIRRKELEWAQSEGRDRFYVGIEGFLSEVADRMDVVEGEHEVRDGVTLLPNGGHTPGHQSLLVETDQGPICLCADIVPQAANIEIPAPSQNPAETEAFMQRIAESGWELLPGHDPVLRQHRYYGARSSPVSVPHGRESGENHS